MFAICKGLVGGSLRGSVWESFKIKVRVSFWCRCQRDSAKVSVMSSVRGSALDRVRCRPTARNSVRGTCKGSVRAFFFTRPRIRPTYIYLRKTSELPRKLPKRGPFY